MRDSDLRQVMARLGVHGLGRTTHTGWINAPCPMAQWTHKNGADRNPSFGLKVSDDGRSTFFCQGCKQKGTIGQLVRKLEVYRKTTYEDLRDVIGDAEQGAALLPDFEAPYGTEEDLPPEPLEEAMWDGLFDEIDDWEVAKAFLNKRGVSREAAAKIGLQYDPDKRRIIFPVRGAAGELYGFSGRSVLPDSKLKVMDYAGLPKRWLILGRNLWVEGKPVLLTEGLIGYARLMTEGLDQIFNVGAALGSEITQQKADILSLFGHGVFLMLDPDPAGDDGIYGAEDVVLKRRKVEDSAIGRLWGQVPLFIPDFPDDVDDIDKLTLEHGRAILRETPLYAPDFKTLKILRGPR